MENREKHRKIFYVPGMISLLLIPILCIWFIKSNRYLHKDYSVDYRTVDSIIEVKSDGIAIYSDENSHYLKRKFRTILFDGKNDVLKLKDLNVLLNQMMTNTDSINGFNFRFGKHCNYQTFISVQDLLFLNKVDFYSCYKNNIYAAAIPPKKPKGEIRYAIPMHCGFASANAEYFAERERQRQKDFFIQSVKQFWQIPLVLLAMAILNIYMLIKFNKNKIYNQKSYI